MFTGPSDYNSSTKKWKEVAINVKVNDWSRTKGVTDSASARIDKSTLPADITSFGARYYFKASYKLGSTTYPDTYHLDFSVNGDAYAFQGKAY